ncbi:class I SAM-dependent methyltransferase [Cetobacterium sp.]|uniref:class I SAM-dependent methyltransferase n=1 Tax=Cetobacterium sp. TaxID=2071632 RepID=UPI003F2E88EB
MFIKEFFKNTKQIGAIFPSSIFLAKAMVSQIDYTNIDVLVELGAGNGVFTKEILKRKSSDTKFIIFEINSKFYKLLKKKYSHLNNVYIFKEKAENLDKVMLNLGLQKIDYVISGLPFLNIPKTNRNKIFQSISIFLEKELILFQYTKLLESELRLKYRLINRKYVLLNAPPAYIYTLKNISLYNSIYTDSLFV